MRKLYFSSRYYKRLARRTKTVTIRLSTSLNEGDIVEVYAGKRYVGKAKIKRIEKRTIKELDTEILKQEGFENMRELVDALIDHYGPMMADPDKKVTVIWFERL